MLFVKKLVGNALKNINFSGNNNKCRISRIRSSSRRQIRILSKVQEMRIRIPSKMVRNLRIGSSRTIVCNCNYSWMFYRIFVVCCYLIFLTVLCFRVDFPGLTSKVVEGTGQTATAKSIQPLRWVFTFVPKWYDTYTVCCPKSTVVLNWTAKKIPQSDQVERCVVTLRSGQLRREMGSRNRDRWLGERLLAKLATWVRVQTPKNSGQWLSGEMFGWLLRELGVT